MKISVSEAKAQLTDLVRRAEAGEEVVLTRHGQDAVRIVPVRARKSPAEILAMIEEIQEAAAAKMTAGPSAARSQDFLYDDDGLPG